MFANQVYQEYIAERHHVHMNATMWNTLTTFCKYLGRTGKCKVDETERGWYIQYINRNADGVEGRETKRKRDKAALDDETRLERSLRKRAKEAASALKGDKEEQATNLVRNSTDEKIVVRLGKSDQQKKLTKDVFGLAVSSKFNEKSKETTSTKRSMSAMEEILFHQEKLKRKEEEAAKKEVAKKEKVMEEDVPWITKDIAVRVLNRDLAKGRFYKQKGIVLSTQEFVAKIEMYEDGKRIRIDQDDLETVIPKIGKKVLVLCGKRKGSVATVISLDKARYKAVLETSDGQQIRKSYDSISKWVG